MRRLAASGLLPERAGQPVKTVVHVSLAELRAMDDGSVLEAEWIAEMRIRWAARRAEASGGAGGDGGAWLDGDAARAMACDASLTPVVTGDVDLGALDELVRLCLQLTGHGVHCTPQLSADPAGEPGPAPDDPPTGLAQLSGMSREAIQRAIIGKAADLLSGPGGLASFLRARQLGARLAGPSLPLDIGYSTAIPRGTPTGPRCCAVTGHQPDRVAPGRLVVLRALSYERKWPRSPVRGWTGTGVVA